MLHGYEKETARTFDDDKIVLRPLCIKTAPMAKLVPCIKIDLSMDLQRFISAANIPHDIGVRWHEPLLEAMTAFQILGVRRQAAFLAQVGHESWSFTRLSESFNYSVPGLKIFGSRLSAAQREELGRNAHERQVPMLRQQRIANIVYANRYGNGGELTGDGWHYRGRGLKQITFHSNYAACGEALGVDLLGNPELLEQERYAAQSAAWFWQARGCNQLAELEDFQGITHAINGPALAGHQDRVARWRRATKHLAM
jgi:putative chitinase